MQQRRISGRNHSIKLPTSKVSSATQRCHNAGNVGFINFSWSLSYRLATMDCRDEVFTSQDAEIHSALEHAGVGADLVNRNRRRIVFFLLSARSCAASLRASACSFLFRLMQGAFGGGFQPMAEAILAADHFPPAKRGLALRQYFLILDRIVCHGAAATSDFVVPPSERRYGNNQHRNHRSLDLKVREGLSHA
jgi:hypothetical protein